MSYRVGEQTNRPQSESLTDWYMSYRVAERHPAVEQANRLGRTDIRVMNDSYVLAIEPMH